jgi:spore coat polysaccharide biosynthesis protein SpsF
MNLGRVGIVVSARTNSSRLPQKALLPLGAKPMILFLLERLREVREGRVVLATTILPSDDQLSDLVSASGVPVFRGSPDDLVQRYCDVADAFGFDTLVRITADCPFVDAALVELCLAAAANEDCDIVSTKGSFPIGLDAEVFSLSTLKTINDYEYLSSQDREHLTLYLYNNNYRVFKVHPPPDWLPSSLVYTIDTQADYEQAQNYLKRIGCNDFSLKALLELE